MKTIAIDFDGVIHKYSKGWQDGSIYDKPFDGVFEAIEKLMKTHTVFIFSTRSPRQIKKWIDKHIWEEKEHWCLPELAWYPKYRFEAQIIPFWTKFWNKPDTLGITSRKFPAEVYIDDRALKFEGNWEKTLKQVI